MSKIKSIQQLLLERMDELHYEKYPVEEGKTKVPVFKDEKGLHGDYFPLHMVETVVERYADQFKPKIIQPKTLPFNSGSKITRAENIPYMNINQDIRGLRIKSIMELGAESIIKGKVIHWQEENVASLVFAYKFFRKYNPVPGDWIIFSLSQKSRMVSSVSAVVSNEFAVSLFATERVGETDSLFDSFITAKIDDK